MDPSFSPESKCPRCGESLPTDAVAGLCPRCLMVGAMQPTQASDQTAPMPILTPEELAPHFPQLEIIECLGRGGMGVVYKARQKSLNRLVALKLLAPERADDPHFAERFEKEALALAALNHPHIVGVYDFGHAGGFYFLLMEFVDGVNLRQAMKAGRFTPEQALAVVPPVCEALQYAHEHGIVHRDIKPENLLLDKEGRVKIADFGIAKMLGESGTGILPVSVESTGKMPVPHSFVAGTPQYMSPEQKAHGVTDHRADIYSLGVVLYEMLTGELPADKLQPPSRKVQIDVRLDEIVLRALEKTPELRYQTAGEFRTQVETVVATPDGSRREPARTSLNPSGQSGHKSAQANTADRVSHHVALIAFISAYAGLLFLLVSTASQLPPRVASHFGLEGQPNGWMGRASYLALFGCLPLLFGGVAVLISWMTRRLPARFINIPRRDFWLTPERRPAVAAFLRRRMFWLAVLMTAFLAGLHLLTVHANQSVPVHLSMDGLLALVIAFLLALLVWTICLLMRLAEVDKPLCVAQPGNNPPPSPVATGNGSALGKWAFGLFLTGILGSLLLMAVLPESGYKAASAVPFGAVALLLSLVFGLMSWRDRFGKIAAIGAGVLTLGGLVVSLVSYADYERTKLQEMEQARRQAEDVNRAVSAEFRVTVYVFEAPADFEERDLRPGDLEDANAVQMTNPTNVVVRSGGEGRIKVPELPLVDESGSGGSGYKKNTLYVKPTLMAAGTRVRLVLERDVPATGARDFIFANSLELGALTIIQSKSVGARKQMAVMKVEMLGSARLRTESPVVRQFGNEPLHLPWKATLLLLGFLYLVYRVWRRYGWWAAFLLVLAALTVVLMMTRSQDVKISPSSPKQVTIRPDEPVQVEAEAKDGSEKSDSKTSTATEKPEAKNAHLVKGLIVTGVLKEIIGNFPTYGPVRVGDAFEIDLSNLPKNKIELSRPHFDAKAHAPPYIPFSTPLLIEQVKEPWGNAKSGFVSGSIRLSSIDASSRLIIQVGTKEFKKGEKVSMSLLQEIYGLINCMATAEGVFK